MSQKCNSSLCNVNVDFRQAFSWSVYLMFKKCNSLSYNNRVDFNQAFVCCCYYESAVNWCGEFHVECNFLSNSTWISVKYVQDLFYHMPERYNVLFVLISFIWNVLVLILKTSVILNWIDLHGTAVIVSWCTLLQWTECTHQSELQLLLWTFVFKCYSKPIYKHYRSQSVFIVPH